MGKIDFNFISGEAMTKHLRFIPILLCVILLISGCGSSSQSRPQPSADSSVSQPAPAPQPSSGGNKVDKIVDKIGTAWDALQAGDAATAQKLLKDLEKENITPRTLFTLGAGFYQGVDDDEKNIHIPKKPDVAFKLILLSAMGGNVEAQIMLAAIFFDGKYVPRNLVQTYVWISIAEKNPEYTPKMGEFAGKLKQDARQQMTPEEMEKAEQLLGGKT